MEKRRKETICGPGWAVVWKMRLKTSRTVWLWRPMNHCLLLLLLQAAPMKSVTAISSSIPSLNKAFRTLFTHSTTNPSLFHTLSRNLQNSPGPITLTFSIILHRQTHSFNHSFISSRKKPSFAVTKCLSSISSSAHTVDWNDAVSCSEIAETKEMSLDREEDEDDASATAVKPYIPVRAFFFSTRFGSFFVSLISFSSK